MTALAFPGRMTATPSRVAVRASDCTSDRAALHHDGLYLPARADGCIDFAPTDHLLMWTREAPAEWTAELRAHSPKSDEHGWLELVWEAGDPWVPGQRWTLYEMLHEQFVDDEILAELHGPHPRSEGHMCSTKVPSQFQCLCRRKLESWRGGPCTLVSLTQYRLYHRTGYFGRPFWIIQGDRGGHKFAFNTREQEMARLADLPGEPPALGSLGYAPFDGRVIKHIVRRNRLTQLGATLSTFRRWMGPDYDHHKQRLARNLRAEYVKWFEDQLLDVNELFMSAARKGEMDDQRKTEIDYEKVEDIATHHYVETGEMLSARAIAGQPIVGRTS